MYYFTVLSPQHPDQSILLNPDSSVSDQHWLKCGFVTSFLPHCISRSGSGNRAPKQYGSQSETDPGQTLPSQKVWFWQEKSSVCR